MAGQTDLAIARINQAHALVPSAKQQNPTFESHELDYCRHYFEGEYQLSKAAFIEWFRQVSFRLTMDDYFPIRLGLLSLSHTGDEELSVILMAAMRMHFCFPTGYDALDEYQDWLTRMQTALGQEGFNAAWEQGVQIFTKEKHYRQELEQFLEDSLGGK